MPDKPVRLNQTRQLTNSPDRRLDYAAFRIGGSFAVPFMRGSVATSDSPPQTQKTNWVTNQAKPVTKHIIATTTTKLPIQTVEVPCKTKSHLLKEGGVPGRCWYVLRVCMYCTPDAGYAFAMPPQSCCSRS